jgi:hypothetical protein
MSNRSAAPFPMMGARFMTEEPSARIPFRNRDRILPDMPAAGQATHKEVPIQELRFRHLKSPEEIAWISHLRQEIQLPPSVLADPGFRAREKKETGKVSWAPLSAGESSSEQFASSRWTAD